MLFLNPIITDSAPIFRLLAFYPRPVTSQLKRIGLIAFPTLFKIPRIIVVGLFLRFAYVRISTYGLTAGEEMLHSGGHQFAEFGLALADTTYASSLLLWNFYRFGLRPDVSVSRPAPIIRAIKRVSTPRSSPLQYQHLSPSSSSSAQLSTLTRQYRVTSWFFTNT